MLCVVGNFETRMSAVSLDAPKRTGLERISRQEWHTVDQLNIRTAVLVVEDDPAVLRTLALGLGDHGYAVISCADAEEALAKLETVSADVALVDLRLPGMSGMDLVRRLRQKSPTTLSIIITGHASIDSALEALRLEASEFLLKPFTIDRVVDAIERGLTRRRRRMKRETISRQVQLNQPCPMLRQLLDDTHLTREDTPPATNRPWLLTYGSIRIDLDRRLVFVGGNKTDLTLSEFKLLATLVERAPAVLSPQELVRQIADDEGAPAEAKRIIRWHIHHLRRKIEVDPKKPQHIVNVRGVGYRLADPLKSERPNIVRYDSKETAQSSAAV